MARKYRLICFDEFHVADITDAMILHRLLQALFAKGVGFVTTSNFHPDALYPNGLHRRPHPAGHRTAQGAAGGRADRRAMAPTTGSRAGAGGDVTTVPAGPMPTPRCRPPSTRLAEAHDEAPVLHIEGSRDPGAAPRRRRGVVRLQDPVRRPALAERLPGDRRRVSTPCC
jgi:cell division protein ZapE